MNTRLSFPHTILGIALIGLALTSLALAHPLPLAQSAEVTPTVSAVITDQHSPTDAGSTDGIVLMAVIILLIVLTPILLRRRDWKNGR